MRTGWWAVVAVAGMTLAGCTADEPEDLTVGVRVCVGERDGQPGDHVVEVVQDGLVVVSGSGPPGSSYEFGVPPGDVEVRVDGEAIGQAPDLESGSVGFTVGEGCPTGP